MKWDFLFVLFPCPTPRREQIQRCVSLWRRLMYWISHTIWNKTLQLHLCNNAKGCTSAIGKALEIDEISDTMKPLSNLTSSKLRGYLCIYNWFKTADCNYWLEKHFSPINVLSNRMYYHWSWSANGSVGSYPTNFYAIIYMYCLCHIFTPLSSIISTLHSFYQFCFNRVSQEYIKRIIQYQIAEFDNAPQIYINNPLNPIPCWKF